MRTVPATAELVPFLLLRMGPVRAAALHQFCGGDPVAAIGQNIADSFPTWCGIDADGVVTLGGVLPIVEVPGAGYVWQFIADIAGHKRAYIEQGRTMLDQALARYERLLSIIEPEYPAALRHIRRLGFAIAQPQDFNGRAGCLCERTRNV